MPFQSGFRTFEERFPGPGHGFLSSEPLAEVHSPSGRLIKQKALTGHGLPRK